MLFVLSTYLQAHLLCTPQKSSPACWILPLYQDLSLTRVHVLEFAKKTELKCNYMIVSLIKHTSHITFSFYRPIAAASRKRKLEIQTKQYTPSIPPPHCVEEISPINPSPAFPESSNPGDYYERRGSITSSGTESSSAEESPVMAHFSSPRASLNFMSPPPQHHSYDKMFLVSTGYPSLLYSPPQLSVSSFDPTVKLPPLRNLVSFKKQKTSTEEDAVLAMMQLSSQNIPQRLF